MNLNLRQLVWLYLILLIFEGALRKWIIPALDAPLLIIRDPVVIWIYYEAWKSRLSFHNAFITGAVALAVVGTILSLAFGIAPAYITLYGLRTDFLQLPFIFIIPQIINREDVISMGKFLLYCSIPIAALVLLQFKSPVDSIWNKGAMATHYNSVRPSGPFSFVTGLSAFYTLTSVFLLYGFMRSGTYKIWLLGLVTFDVLGASAVSGSRLQLASIGIVTLVAVMCVITRGKGGLGMLIAGVIIAIAVSALSSTSIIQEGTMQMDERMTDAGRVEGNETGFANRALQSLLVAFDMVDHVPFFGYGLGLGTNVGFGLFASNAKLMWPEAEWSRLLFESGPVFGLTFCLYRFIMMLALGWAAFKAYRNDNFLPALLFGACALPILSGQWGVATTLGFAMFGAGLMLAACVEPPDWEDEHDEEHDHDHENEHDPEHDSEHDDEHGHDEEDAGDEPDHSRTTDTIG
jgi:hypothetical protein